MRSTKTFYLYLFLALITGVPCLLAEEPNVSVSVDRQSVQVGEEVNLTLRITGAMGNIQAPRLPVFKGFDAYYTGRASQITFVNNVSTNRVEFSYVLIPHQPGRFAINPIEVLIGGNKFTTKSVEIVVTPGGMATSGAGAGQKAAQPQSQTSSRTAGYSSRQPAQQAQTAAPYGASQSPVASQGPIPQEPAPAFRPEDDNIFIKAAVDKTSVFPNEQIILTYSLYTRYDTRYEGFAEEPEMSGFWIEEFPMERDVRRDTVRVNGKRYIKADIRKIALFPTSPADYVIQPGTIKASIRQDPESRSIFDEFFNDSFFSGAGFFSRRENRILKPEPIRIQVKPLPENGKPADFKGATGTFRMTAFVDKQNVKQNDPVTLKLIIEGQGNIETLDQPALPENSDFKVYESDSSSQLLNSGNLVGGQKTFEIVFIPLKSGDLKIPALSFSFFNPYEQRYQTLRSQEFPLSVAPSDKPFELPKNLTQQDFFKKDIELEGKDIHYIHEKFPDDISKQMAWLLGVFSIVDGLLAFLVLLAMWQGRLEKKFAKDTALKRRRFARSVAETRIRKLKPLGRSQKYEDTINFYEEIDKILTQYLSDKFNLSAYGTTRDDIEKELAAILGSGDPLYSSILEVYKICDESRFGKGDANHNLKQDALKVLRQTITRVERKRR